MRIGRSIKKIMNILLKVLRVWRLNKDLMEKPYEEALYLNTPTWNFVVVIR